MLGKVVVVAALLLTSLSQVAAADEEPKHSSSKNADKLIVLLASVGIDNADINEFINELDARIDSGYLHLAEDRMGGGTLKLQLQLKSNDNDMFKTRGGGLKRLELRFTPDESHFQAIARPDRVMVNYRLQF